MKQELKLGLVALFTAYLAACGTDTSGPANFSDEVIDADIAMLAADGALDDLSAMHERTARGAFEHTRTVLFFGEGDAPQNEYHPTETMWIEITSEMSGEITRDNWSATMNRNREIEITGLLGEETERTVNGVGSESSTRVRNSDEFGTRTYVMSGTSVINNVVHGVPREEFPHPLSGSITRDIEVVITNGPNGDETRSRTVVITFNGTEFPEMTVDGVPFEVDMSAPGGPRPFRKGHHGGPGK
jgi:hypothetical protein